MNYDDAKLGGRFGQQAAAMGTQAPRPGRRAYSPEAANAEQGHTFNAYVNDAIGYGLDPEVVLYHSENAFGTADAIGFDEKKHTSCASTPPA